MSALRDFIADLSFTDARTLLQTGNKVPRSLMSRGSKRISFIQPASADHASLTRLSKRCLALAPQVGTGIPSQKLAGLAFGHQEIALGRQHVVPVFRLVQPGQARVQRRNR